MDLLEAFPAHHNAMNEYVFTLCLGVFVVKRTGVIG